MMLLLTSAMISESVQAEMNRENLWQESKSPQHTKGTRLSSVSPGCLRMRRLRATNDASELLKR